MAPAAGAVAGGSRRKDWSDECRNLWRVAGPVILTGIFQFLLGFVTTAFVGHIGKVELAAVSIVNGVVEGLAFGLLLGMGSALETLCGQAVGAGQLHMLGVYMQRSWIICLATALALLPLYVLASPILRLLRQSADISAASGRYARWCVPQLFAYAVNFPIQKFYQAQSRVWVMTAISGAVLAVHALLNWLVVARLGRGLVGAAVVGDVSWWLVNVAQFVYLVGGSFPGAWTGFSRKAFASLGGFVRLSIASAVMLWEYTYNMSSWRIQPRDVVLHGSAHSGGMPEEPRDSSRCNLHMHELSALDTHGCCWLQCCSKCSRVERARRQQSKGCKILCCCCHRHIGRHRRDLHGRCSVGEEADASAFHWRRRGRQGDCQAGVPPGRHHIPQQHPTGVVRRGDRCRVAVLSRVRQHRQLLPRRPAPRSCVWVQAEAQCNRDLGGRVDWDGVTDCDSVCNPQQNQMAERGYASRGENTGMGRKRRAATDSRNEAK